MMRADRRQVAGARESTDSVPRPTTQGTPAVRSRSSTASACSSINVRRSSSAIRISSLIVPVASGISPTIRRGTLRDCPEPVERAVATATLCRSTAAMSSASSNSRARTRRGSSASTSWWLASARRSSAVSGPKASDSIAAVASSSESPEVRSSDAQRSRCAAAAMVSYSAASCAIVPQVSCSATSDS